MNAHKRNSNDNDSVDAISIHGPADPVPIDEAGLSSGCAGGV